MWISKKRFKVIEKKVADLERNQSQLVDVIEKQIEIQQSIKIDEILSSINHQVVELLQEQNT